MRRALAVLVVLTALAPVGVGAAFDPGTAAGPAAPAPSPSSSASTPGVNPAPDVTTAVSFEENVGQTAAGARFRARIQDATLFLADDGVWLTMLESPKKTDQAAARRPAGGAPAIGVTPTTAAMRQGVNLKLSFPGSNPHPQIVGFDLLPTRIAYFVGTDSTTWHPNVPVWGGARYVDLYPGVDLELSSQDGALTWRLVDRTGQGSAALAAAHLQVDGPASLRATAGRLLLTTAIGKLNLPLLQGLPAGAVAGPPVAPSVTQLSATPGNASFDVASPFADPASPAVAAGATNVVTATDLAYGTYLGGSTLDAASAVVSDGKGNVYITGSTLSSDFPTTTGSFQKTWNAAATQNAFITLLHPGGKGPADVLASTFIGGTGASGETPVGIQVYTTTTTVNVYIAGYTDSTDFPTTGTTSNPYQKTSLACPGSLTGFIAELSNTITNTNTLSTLVYGTYYGGTNTVAGNCVANTHLNALTLDSSGNVFVAGETTAPDLPMTANAYQATCGGAATDTCDNGFLARLSLAGNGASDLKYATFLGGSVTQGGILGTGTSVNALAVGGSGRVYLAGETTDTDFPVTTGAFQTACPNTASYSGCDSAFLARINGALTGTAQLDYSTYLGGTAGPLLQASYSVGSRANGIVLDGLGNVYLSGETTALDFPTTSGAFQTGCTGSLQGTGCDSAFVSKLSMLGQGNAGLISSTYLGGTVNISTNSFTSTTYTGYGTGALGIVRDSSGNLYVAGETQSTDFPSSPGAFQTTCPASPGGGCDSAYLVKLDSSLKTLLYSVFIGGTGPFVPASTNAGGFSFISFANYGNPLTIDTSNDTWVVGQTAAKDLPVTLHSFQSKPNVANLFSGGNEGFGLRLNTSASNVISTTETPTPGPQCPGLTTISNGDFETGLTCWNIFATNPTPQTSAAQVHSGTASLLLGSTGINGSLEPLGNSGVYQQFTVPTGNSWLSFWYWPNSSDGFCNQGALSSDLQQAYLTDTNGNLLATLLNDCQETQTWTSVVYDLSALHGQTIRLVFNVFQDGYGDPTVMYVDDVALSASQPTPTNTPTITLTPTSSLTPTITVTRTPSITQTPTMTPTVSATGTRSTTGTPTPSLTATVAADTPTVSATVTTDTPTITVTGTPTPAPTSGPTETATDTPTVGATVPETPTDSATVVPSTDTPTETATAVPSTNTPTETATAVPSTNTPTETATVPPGSTNTPTTIPTAVFTSTSTPTATATATFPIGGTFTPTLTPSPTSTIAPVVVTFTAGSAEHIATNNGQVQIDLPADFLGPAANGQTVTLSISQTTLPAGQTVDAASPLLVLEIDLSGAGYTTGTPFAHPITVTMNYDPIQVEALGLDPANLKIYILASDGTVQALPSVVDETAHTVTASIPHLTKVVLAAPHAVLFLPVGFDTATLPGW